MSVISTCQSYVFESINRNTETVTFKLRIAMNIRICAALWLVFIAIATANQYTKQILHDGIVAKFLLQNSREN